MKEMYAPNKPVPEKNKSEEAGEEGEEEEEGEEAEEEKVEEPQVIDLVCISTCILHDF